MAVLEDIVLWLALAVAIAAAGKAVLDPRAMSYHLLATVAFFILGLTIVPRLIKRVNKSSLNVFAKHSPTGYALAVLLAYCVLAGVLDISMVFAAFLAGFAVVHKKRRLFSEALDAIGKFSFAFFIPVYFAIVGLKLDLIRGVSLWMMVAFIGGTCIVKVSLRLIGGPFRGISRIGSHQSRHNHERTRRPRHSAGQRSIRCWHHQSQFDDPGGGSRRHLTGRWSMAGTMCCAKGGLCLRQRPRANLSTYPR